MLNLNGTYATVKDACKLLECTEGYVRRMLIAGRLDGIKIGREWIIPVINGKLEVKEKIMSKRSDLAERLAAKIRELKLVNPHGGDVSQDSSSRGKPYKIGFSLPAYLDGEVVVYSEKFIRLVFESPGQGRHSLVLETEQNAMKMLEAITTGDWDTVHLIPRKEN
jgi:excisionase family DNA binding protein